MGKLYRVIPAALLLLSIDSFAQKIVFTDEFNTKNVAYDGAGGARIVEDSLTKEKVFIYSGKKEIIFYQLDPKWKIIRKLSKSPNKESQFSDKNFSVVRAVHNKDRWTFIVKDQLGGYNKESVDFATETHTVGGKFLTDMARNFSEEVFIDGSDSYIMYMNSSKQIRIASFSGDMTTTAITLDLNSSLPVGKSKKYTTEELYTQVVFIDSFAASSPYFTRKKVHFYTGADRYTILVAGEEPVVELHQYDKKTGRKIKSELFSVQSLLPKGEDGRFNTAALFFNNKVHVLTANKSGGVYAAFDPETKAVAYQYAFTEKDKTVPFNYGPVMYETLPGTISTSVLKEKVEDISMEKFCTEMYKHSCAITARYMADRKLLVTLANYDMKQLAAATSPMRSGMNTMTSSDWYVSTSAGLIFEPGAWQLSAKKTTWNEVNNSKAGESYAKVAPSTSSDAAAEYNDKRSYVLKTQFIDNRRYTIYFTASKELKIHEKILPFAPPKIAGLTD